LEIATTIGEQLRLAREERGIALREISNQTRISMRYLEGIETNDYSRLPGGIFNRSFVKAYAKCVGFDEKQAVEGYARLMREQGQQVDEADLMPHYSKVYTDAPATRSPLLTVFLAIVILAILTLAALAAVHWYQRRSATAEVRLPAAGASSVNVPSGTPALTDNSTGFDQLSRNYEYFL
jgi:cytoskeletal protein RodZ